MKTLEETLKRYAKGIIIKPGYVIEVGHSDIIGGVRKYFENYEDYCMVDDKRVIQVDIISEYSYLGKLFDYQPNVIISMSLFNSYKKIKSLIKDTRELLMPGGYFIVLLDIKNKDTLKYLFEGYKTKDVSFLNVGEKSMICGIARKPYRIDYEPKDNP
jgi:hypothetical protein